MPQNITDWLNQWTADNLDPKSHAEEKSDMQDAAKRLVEAGTAAGYSVEELKDAAQGDVERYLLDAQNAGHVAD